MHADRMNARLPSSFKTYLFRNLLKNRLLHPLRECRMNKLLDEFIVIHCSTLTCRIYSLRASEKVFPPKKNKLRTKIYFSASADRYPNTSVSNPSSFLYLLSSIADFCFEVFPDDPTPILSCSTADIFTRTEIASRAIDIHCLKSNNGELGEFFYYRSLWFFLYFFRMKFNMVTRCWRLLGRRWNIVASWNGSVEDAKNLFLFVVNLYFKK